MRYRLRLMTSLVVSELFMLVLFYFFPSSHTQSVDFSYEEPQNTEIEQVDITRQTDVPAAPPKPEVPVNEPEDELVREEVNIEPLVQKISLPEELGSAKGNKAEEGRGQMAEPVKNPDRPPQLYKIVEPEMPDQAKKAGIKAIIDVRFLINTEGRVEEATIAAIKIYNEEGEYRQVDHINYGLPQVTLNAALQWKFRPAVKNGQKVASYSIHPFSYGL